MTTKEAKKAMHENAVGLVEKALKAIGLEDDRAGELALFYVRSTDDFAVRTERWE